jgi:hypothetical protein
MNDSYCMNKDELNLFIENALYGREIEDPHVLALIQNSSNWLIKSQGLTYFLGRIIQKKINNSALKEDYIESVYKLQDLMFFDLNEFEGNFIDFVLQHDRTFESNTTLDEILNFLHNNYSENNYDRIIRS